MRMKDVRVFSTLSLAVVGVIGGSASLAPAAAIGINISTAAQQMTAGDTAGIGSLTGARISNFNNVNGPTSQGNAVTLSNLNDDSGTGTGAAVTLTGGSTNYGGTFAFGGTQTNDAQLYNTVFDQYSGTAGTLSVTGIPYANYSLIAYVYNDTGSPGRGGSITVGTQTYYIATGTTNGVLTGIGNPTNTGTGYVRSTDTTSVADAAAVGNYVEFDNLTGSSLTASFLATNGGTARMKVSGFEIVSTPEPASLGLIGGAAAMLISRRRRV